MRIYREVIRKEITESEQQNNQNEATSETKWENIKKVLSSFVGEVGGHEEKKKRNDWCDKECRMKVEEINKARNKMLRRRTKMNIENFKNKRRGTKKINRAKRGGGGTYDFKVLAGMGEANKRKKSKKIPYNISRIKAGFQP
jgi:hypothetical protein